MKDKLREAIETGEILNVRYFGGSTPGAERGISPVKLLDDKVRARCMETGAVKTFVIAKMELVIPGEPSKLEVKQSFNPPELGSISEIAHFLSDSIELLGWIIQTTDTSLTLHTAFKNGKVKKTPVLSLNFEEFDYIYPEPDINSPDFSWNDFIPSDDRSETEGEPYEGCEKVKRKRPWIVRAKNKDTITYGLSNKAMIRLMEWADELSPNKI